MAQTSARRRHSRRVIGLSLAYAVLLIAAEWLFKHQLIGGALAYIVAVLPALPIVGIFLALGRYLVEERDEYVRMLEVRQTLVASGFALSVATVWGFLESFGLAGHVDAYYIAIVWFFGMGVGDAVNRIASRGNK